MIWTGYHSTEISNRQTEMFREKAIFYTFVGGTFSLDISIEKMGFPRVYLFFLFLLQNIDCGYSLELARRLEPPGSKVYPQSMF